jgi:predicted phosphodiesterase
MMRVALLSDIHGNLIALDAVLADLARRGPFDEVVVAGDLVWAGPWPAEVVDRVRSMDSAVIQGNTDAFFRHRPEQTPPGKRENRFAEQMEWMLERLGPNRTEYLADLPASHSICPAAGHELLVVHANPYDLDRPITPNSSVAELDELLFANGVEPGWDTLAFGHVHTPFQRRWRGRLLIDVASTGLPMDGDPRAVYAILTWDGSSWQGEHYRVFYELPVVARQMTTGGMPRGRHFAERLMGASYSAIPARGMLGVE